jgi:hypothetical protein
VAILGDQILAALDKNVRPHPATFLSAYVRLCVLVSALVLTNAQGRIRMSALQSPPLPTSEKCEMRTHTHETTRVYEK